MANERVVVEKVTRGHLKSSSKVISKYKGDLTKNLDQVKLCLVSLERLSIWPVGVWQWTLRCWQWHVGLDTRGYWRSLAKVIWRDTLIYCEVWSDLCLMIYIEVWAMGVEVSVAVEYPTGYTTLLQSWINVTGVDSRSQQRYLSLGMSPEVIFRGAYSTKGFTSPERNLTSPYHRLLCICKENP